MNATVEELIDTVNTFQNEIRRALTASNLSNDEKLKVIEGDARKRFREWCEMHDITLDWDQASPDIAHRSA